MIRMLREGKGMTQEQLAKKVGVTRPYLTQLELAIHPSTW